MNENLYYEIFSTFSFFFYLPFRYRNFTMTTADPLELETFLERSRNECWEKLNQSKSIYKPGILFLFLNFVDFLLQNVHWESYYSAKKVKFGLYYSYYWSIFTAYSNCYQNIIILVINFRFLVNRSDQLVGW